MPISMSSAALAQKNKITSNEAWLLLVSFKYKTEDAVNVCMNGGSVVWNGITWAPVIFSLSDITESKDGSIPSTPLSFFDPNRQIIPIIDQYDGANGAVVTVRVINTALLSETEAARTRIFTSMSASIKHNGLVVMNLGVPNLTTIRDPQDRYFKNHGRSKVKFGDSICGYTGSETECNKTLARCRELGNSSRYCGFPGVGQTGFLV